ncbi:helix-turn-helix domain-containing protein [Nitrospirota bacterium]
MRLLTVKDMSQHLCVKEKTLYQWAELEQIPHIKLNGCLRFDLTDIEAWVEESKKTPVSGYNPLTQARGPRKGGK